MATMRDVARERVRVPNAKALVGVRRASPELLVCELTGDRKFEIRDDEDILDQIEDKARRIIANQELVANYSDPDDDDEDEEDEDEEEGEEEMLGDYMSELPRVLEEVANERASGRKGGRYRVKAPATSERRKVVNNLDSEIDYMINPPKLEFERR